MEEEKYPLKKKQKTNPAILNFFGRLNSEPDWEQILAASGVRLHGAEQNDQVDN